MGLCCSRLYYLALGDGAPLQLLMDYFMNNSASRHHSEEEDLFLQTACLRYQDTLIYFSLNASGGHFPT